MTIKTVSRRNWPDGPDGAPYTTWYEPHVEPERIRAAVSWVLAHAEITGLATAGETRLLQQMVVRTGQPADLTPEAAAAILEEVHDYASPFVDIPI